MAYGPVVAVLVCVWWVQTALTGVFSFRRRRLTKQERAKEESSPGLCGTTSRNGYDLQFGPTSVVGNTKPSWICGGGLFGTVWTILYILLAVELSLLFLDSKGELATPSAVYVAAIVLRVVQGFCNALWSPLAFGKFQWRLALAVIVLGLCSSIASQVLVAIEGLWVPFGLHAPNTVWLAVATVLNVKAVMWYSAAEDRQKKAERIFKM